MAPRSRRRRRHPKTISAQGLTGQRGVNFIERVVLEMGSRWTPSGPNEVGIDGYIELFDPNSHQSLGLTVAVQSKVTTAIANDSNPTFDYWCDANDLEYWLNGNTPVILVVSSPASNEGYWISVKDYFKDWTPAEPARVTFVKAQHRFIPDSLRLLVAIAAPKPGLYLAPARHQETLHTNLLPLDACPARIFIACTDCRTPHDVWALLRATKQESDAGWVLWERKILSFHDLSEGPWSSICEVGTVEGFATAEWSESSDSQRRRVFVQLLNQTLKAQLSPEVRYWPQEDCYAIVGRPRKLSYQSLKRPSKITVVSLFSATAADGRVFEWVRHMAFRGQFRSLEGQWYWELTPTYRFTHDGHALDRFHEDRLKGIKRIEGNRAVLSAVLFWADYLQPNTTLFGVRAPALQFGQLLTLSFDVGIVDRAWLSDDPDFARDTELNAKQLFDTRFRGRC
jgi:hypothetical protein